VAAPSRRRFPFIDHPLSPSQERNLKTHGPARARPQWPDPDISAHARSRRQAQVGWHSSNTRRRGWCAAGLTLSARRRHRAARSGRDAAGDRPPAARPECVADASRPAPPAARHGPERPRRDPGAGRGAGGYTNAGKSTLFRALTGADATSRTSCSPRSIPRVRNHAGRCRSADTVGFIRERRTAGGRVPVDPAGRAALAARAPDRRSGCAPR
jgi:hypothetical protein